MKELDKRCGYVLMVDQDNFEVARVAIVKEGKTKGKETICNKRYLPTFEKAVIKYADLIARTSPDTVSLKSYVEKYREVTKELKGLLGGEGSI